MKAFPFLLVLALVAVSVSVWAQGSGAAGGSGLKIAFEDRKLALEKDLQAKRAAMLLRYADALGRIGQRYQSEGKLDAAIVVRTETEAAQQGRLTPAGADGGALPELANARRVAEAELQKLDAAHQAELGTLCGRYLQALENLKKTLTQSGDLAGATAAQEEIARVSALRSTSLKKTLSPGLQKGLLLHYAFEKDNGAIVDDSSPALNHGMAEGGRFVAAGKVSGAFSLDGAGDRIALSKSLPDSAELTFCAWVNYEGDGSSGGLFSDYGDASGNDVMFALNGEKKVHLRADKDGARLNAQVELRSSLKGGWRHLAWVVEKDRSILYVDGKRAERVDQTGSNVAHHKAYIGFANNGADWTYFRGQVDEVMIWSRALSASEVGEVAALAAEGS